MFTRRHFIRTSSSLALGACTGVLPLRAQAADFRELRRGVGVFVAPGGTIGWLAAPQGALVIDSQFPATAADCIERLRGRTPARIEALINTHHHADHTAGNVTFRPLVARIVQQERCAKAAGQAGLADVTFTESWSTTIGDERVMATYYGPAHTSGDAAIVFERANIVHLGDLVFHRIPPFVDRASGASIRNWIAVLERIEAKHADALFVFGHGRADAVTGTVADVRRFREYLSAMIDYVQRSIAAGRSLEETARLDRLPGFPESETLVKNYASAFPEFTLNQGLTAAYQELTAAR